MIVWGRAKDIQQEVAHVPSNWLIRFAVMRPDDVRKLGDEQNSSLLFRVSAVLEAIETGECNRKRKFEPDPTPADIKSCAQHEEADDET